MTNHVVARGSGEEPAFVRALGRGLFLLIMPLLMLLGCADGAPLGGDSEQELGKVYFPLTNCGTALGDAPLQNSCGHGFVGPFGDGSGTGSQSSPIVASANLNFTTPTPSFSAPQVLYRVSLPGSPNANQSAVKFTPQFSQDYVVATSVDIPFTVRSTGTTTVAPIVDQNVQAACNQIATTLGPGSAGAALVRLRVFPLIAGTEYRIVFGPAATSQFNVLIDEPNDFLNVYFRDADADGFGDKFLPLLSECAAPSGFVGDGFDCNDANASINPNATENTTDGVDNNCDTLIDTATGSADLVMVSLTAQGGPGKRVLVGQNTVVAVREVVSNNDLVPLSGRVTTTAVANTSGSTISPASTVTTQPNLRLGEDRPLNINYTLACTTPGRKTFTINANIQPSRAGDVDPNPANNSRTLTLTLDCVACMHGVTSVALADRTFVTVGKLLGGKAFQLGSDNATATVTADVAVNGNAFLRSNSRINGNLTTAGTMITQGPFTVTGTVLQNTPVTIPPIAKLAVTVGTTDLTVNAGQTLAWGPGAYRDGLVRQIDAGIPAGRANLIAGAYSFRTLTLEPDATLSFDTTGGDIFISVDGATGFGDRAKFLKTGTGQVAIYTNATGTVRLGTDIQPFNASITAPNALLQVFSRTTINGCTAANQISFEPDVIENSTNIPVNYPSDPLPLPPSTCSNGVQDGTETGVDCGTICQNTCPPPPLPISATFPVTSNWGSGYCVNIAVKNNGTRATMAWTVRFNTNQSTIANSWNGNFTGNRGTITTTPFTFNSVINPGQTITSAGFCANRDSGNTTALPTLVSATGF
jgi:hypothetical protein